MKIISLNILKILEQQKQEPIFLASQYDLSFVPWIKRGFFKEGLKFGIRTTVNKIDIGNKAAIKIENSQHVCYVDVNINEIAVVIVCDLEYPQKAVWTIINQMKQEFNKLYQINTIQQYKVDQELQFPQLEKWIQAYQDPNEADKLYKLENTLNEVQDICYQNLNQILKNGETLEQLMDKSKDVSTVSNNLYKQARKTNKQCCILI